MPVVTVSGGLASGAREVARLAARRLDYDYVDQEILVQAARALGVSYEWVESRDERTVSLGERLAAMLRTFLERSAAAGVSDPMMGGPGLETLLARTYGEAAGLTEAEEPGFDERRYIETLTFVIREIASKGDVVILGRGSQLILRDWPQALHVLVLAPMEERVRLLCEREGIDREEAVRRIQESDRHRAAFHRKFFKADPSDPCLYDLVVRLPRVNQDTAAELIATAARAL